MLSYQHAYHAGNFADVHKHLALVLMMEKLCEKAKPFCYVDSHAGRALYDLASDEARKTGESDYGISKISEGIYPGYDAVLKDLRTRYGEGAYPGSPMIAKHYLREGDEMVLIELHPQENRELHRLFHHNPQVHIHKRDAFEALNAILPPKIKRGLVLIDPSYEIKDEYDRMAAAVAGAHKRWSSAIFAIWYPILAEGRHRDMLRGLAASGLGEMLVSELMAPNAIDGHRMLGSGLVVINAPWQFDEKFKVLGAAIAKAMFGAAGKHELVKF